MLDHAMQLTKLVGITSLLLFAETLSGQACEHIFGRQFPAGDIDGRVYDMAVLETPSGPEMYVAGSFAVAGGVQTFNVAKWTSNGFEPIEGTQIRGSVHDIAYLDEDGPGPQEPTLHIAGGFTIQGQPGSSVARWTGSDWETIGAFNSTVESIVVFDDGNGPALYAGGTFDRAWGLFGWSEVTRIVKWNGVEWVSLQPTPLRMVGGVWDMLVYDDGSGEALYVAGDFSERPPTHVGSGVKKWTGSGWVDLGVGLGGQGWAVAVYDDGNGPALYAGGGFTTAGGVPANHIAKWNGSSWEAVAGGTNGTVYSLAVDPSNATLFVGGDFTTVDGMESRSIASWDGVQWTPYADGPDGAVLAVSAIEENAASVVYAGGLFPTPGTNISRLADDTWKPLGNSVDDRVFEIATIDTPEGQKLVVGGEFLTVGGGTIPASKIAMWDGQWSPLGSGFDDSVFAIAQYDAGNGPEVFVGGQFRVATTLSAANVASWDGTAWSELGGGVTGHVSTATVFDGGFGPALYIGGLFTVNQDPSIRNLARWSGVRWVPVGDPPGDKVWHLLVHDDGSGPALFAVGNFPGVAGVADTRGIAKWDGLQWSSVGGGFNQVGIGMAVFDDGSGAALYAGGQMTDAGGVPVGYIGRWDGTSWSDVAGGVTGGSQPWVKAIKVHNDGSGPALYVIGSFTTAGSSPATRVARFDGSTWSAVGGTAGSPGGGVGGSTGEVNAIEVFDSGSGARLIVAGSFAGAVGAISVRNMAVWNGATWSSTGFDRPNEVFDLEVFDAGNGPRLYAGYIRRSFGVGLDGGMASWDGNTWTPTTIVGGATAPRVFALVSYNIGGRTSLLVGGQFDDIGARTVNYIARWDGNEWYPIGVGANNGVKDLLVWDDGSGPALYVAGGFSQIGGQPIVGLAKWDGVVWSQLGTGIETGGRVAKLAVHDDGTGPALYLAGKFGQVGGLVVNDIAKWNGSDWSALGTGFGGSDEVYALQSFDGGGGAALYVGGNFRNAGGMTTSDFAKWDGTAWSSVGNPNGRISALGVFTDQNGSHLYASGPFTSIGGIQANHLARFDGVSWESFGSGLQGLTFIGGVETMSPMEDSIGPAMFMGGTFVRANGVSSDFLGRWGCGPGDSLACYPDCDGNGTLDIFDFLCFQNRFVLGEPYACDCDPDPACDIFDFLCFQNAFVAGCP